MIPRRMIQQRSPFVRLRVRHIVHRRTPATTRMMVLIEDYLHPHQPRRRSFSSSSTTANTTPPPPTIKDDNRIPPIIETNPSLLTAIIDPVNRLHGTITHFKNGLNRLIDDYYLVRCIHDATMTRVSLMQRNSRLLPKNKTYPDRRAREHLRQFGRDIAITLPTVAAFILLPVVGNVALFLGMVSKW